MFEEMEGKKREGKEGRKIGDFAERGYKKTPASETKKAKGGI